MIILGFEKPQNQISVGYSLCFLQKPYKNILRFKNDVWKPKKDQGIFVK